MLSIEAAEMRIAKIQAELLDMVIKLTFKRKQTELVHRYLQKHENCFTLLPACIEGHFLTILIHKNSEGMHIYVIDSNGEPFPDCIKLQHALKDHFQERHRTVHCESY